MLVNQEKFAFDIKADPQDNSSVNEGAGLRLTSSNTSYHPINIKSSGDWELFVDDNKWLANDLKQPSGSGDVNFNVWADVNSSETTARTVTLRLVSTLHSNDKTGVWSEDEYTRKFEITQDELHCAILTEKDGADFTRTNILAFDQNGLSQSFYLDCSVPWKVVSKPSWITLTQNEGDGTEYLTIDMAITTNTGSTVRDGAVTIKAAFDKFGSVL